MINITVAYALPEKQWVWAMQTPAGSTVLDVLNKCQLLSDFPSMEISAHKIGIYGHEVSLEKVEQEGNRVEIYRPLIRDAKTARRLRAQKKKT
jgi:hypothetical protein